MNMKFSSPITIIAILACTIELVTAGVVIAAPIASDITTKDPGDCALGVVTDLGCS